MPDKGYQLSRLTVVTFVHNIYLYLWAVVILRLNRIFARQ
jgi:hypothetical protein